MILSHRHVFLTNRMEEETDEQQTFPVDETDKNIVQTNTGDEEEESPYVYLKSSSIISILIIVIFSLVSILTITLLARSALHTQNITRTLFSYLGFLPNRTQDETILTYWSPINLNDAVDDEDEQPIETTTTIVRTHSPPSSRFVLSHSERKAQKIFRNIFLPCLLLTAIICGCLAFYMRLRHHLYPAWGARPKQPKQYLTLKIKAPI